MSDQYYDGLVRGGIIMWYGDSKSIPLGYWLCDGSIYDKANNRTPDLRDKFILGAGGKYALHHGNAGGNETITLTTDQMPQHTHQITIDSSGDHTHTTPFDIHNFGGSGDIGPLFSPAGVGTTTVTTSTNGDHSHTASASNAGNGNTVNIMPPYYGLYFIMKIV